jgi:acyl-CoA synthetase (AMP-forming)/AMP-acid ligase II
VRATHPPSPADAARYRDEGRWLPARSAGEILGGWAAGGDRTALADDHTACSYRTLAAMAESVCATLVRAGARPGDPVLVIAPLRVGAVAAVLGSRLAGCVTMLLDRRCGTADVTAACEALPPRVIMAFDDDARRLGLESHLSLETVSDGGEMADVLLDPDTPSLVLFTSGTTSAPRGVLHTLNSLRCGTQNMVNALGLDTDDTLLLSSPLASITGVLQIESALAVHAKVVLADRFSPDLALAAVLHHRVTVIGGAPIIAETVFAEAERCRVSKLPLRCLALGGTMIGPSVLAAARRFGVEYVRVYGSSEVPFSTAAPVNVSGHDGAPMPGVEVCIRPDGSDELLIRGPHQFHGYLDHGDNAEAFCDGWVRTGDAAEFNGVHIRITGRLKDVVARKGLKISLAEIDSAAACLGDCASFALPDSETGERVALAVRAPFALGYDDVVERLLATGLARWKLPEQIVVWDGELPRTASGKIVRRDLIDSHRHLQTLLAPRLR